MKLIFKKYLSFIILLLLNSIVNAQIRNNDSTNLLIDVDTLAIDGKMYYLGNNLQKDSIFLIYSSLAKDTSKWECYECERRKEFLYQENRINDSIKEISFINGEISTVLKIDSKGNILSISNKVREIPYHNSIKIHQSKNHIEITENDLSLELKDYINEKNPFEILKTDTINNSASVIEIIETTTIKTDDKTTVISSKKIKLIPKQSD